MNGLRVYVSGIGVWSPELASFASLQRWLTGDTPEPATSRPPATMLPPNERRRAPDSVLLAIEVAGQAVAMSGQDASELACVFSSSHGDQPITDYMCETLARAPAELSPIRFHNSVHNAAAGYWTIATGCHAASTAISAQRASFGAGLLEAACQVLTEQRPVLLVCSDTAASGPLTAITGCDVPFGCALVLTPAADAHTVARLDLNLHPGSITATPSSASIPADWAGRNASAPALPLLAMLAAQGAGNGSCRLRVADALGMDVHMETSA
jgi:hypothetical protein